MPQHVRKGDLVQVISGGDKNKQGTVLRVMPREDRVLVQGVNVRKKNVRPSQQNPQGGTVELEMPLHISNVQPVVDGKPTRVRFETRDDGSKVRVAASTGAVIGDPLKKARAK
jgi:large subunit ribosomal protein L24